MEIVDRTVVLDELKECTLEEVLREVVRRQEALIVHLPDGETVAIQPSRRLKPLPELEGFIPEGWKEANCG
jgi:hypothetical protein